MQEDLIRKYFTGNCSPEEKRRIYLYFKNNPARFLDYFTDEEWSSLQTDPVPNYSKPADQKKQSVFILRRTPVPLYKSLVAAGIILLLSLPLFLHKSVVAPPYGLSKTQDTVLAELVENNNTSQKVKQVELPDGSSVELSKGSSISYLKNFEPTRRDIHLKGTAVFKVSKNAHRPFTVYCNKIATTALGTKFKICTSNKKEVFVNLLEGRIVVRSTQAALSKAKYYLTEGNAIAFDLLKNTVKILSATKTNEFIPSEPASSVTQSKEGNIHFENISLPKALDYLAQKRQIKIQYPAKHISKIRFIGTVYNNEPTKDILHNVALMTDLQLSVNSDTMHNDTLYLFKPAN